MLVDMGTSNWTLEDEHGVDVPARVVAHCMRYCEANLRPALKPLPGGL